MRSENRKLAEYLEMETFVVKERGVHGSDKDEEKEHLFYTLPGTSSWMSEIQWNPNRDWNQLMLVVQKLELETVPSDITKVYHNVLELINRK